MASERERSVLAGKGSVPPIRPSHRNTARECSHIGICNQLRLSSEGQPYLPPTKPYELSALAADLVVLARYLLNPGGRLVFFLPTVIDEYKVLDLDSMLCDGMEVVANSLQDFGAWGRRVRTKTADSALRDWN